MRMSRAEVEEKLRAMEMVCTSNLFEFARQRGWIDRHPAEAQTPEERLVLVEAVFNAQTAGWRGAPEPPAPPPPTELTREEADAVFHRVIGGSHANHE